MKSSTAKRSSLRWPVLALALTTLLASGLTPAWGAQDDARDGAGDVARSSGERAQAIVPIEHADPDQLAKVLQIFPLQVRAHDDLGLITLKGEPEAVEAAKAAIATLDVPSDPEPSVEVTVWILSGFRSGAGDGPAGFRSLPMPAGLQPVADQLRTLFGYQEVGLVETLFVRGWSGAPAQLRGRFSAGGDPVGYELEVGRIDLNRTNRDRVALRTLAFQASPRAESEAGQRLAPVHLVTDVEVETGQKAVVGKIATPGIGETLILVVEAKVLD